MRNLSASSSQPESCPYCRDESSVSKLKEDSLLKAPFRGLPYEPLWHCVKCGGKVLESYSGGVFWGNKMSVGEVTYRFLFTIKGNEVSFLDDRNLIQREISDVQRALFYDIIEIMPLSEKTSAVENGWKVHLSYPATAELISYSGSPRNGIMILKEAINALGLKVEFRG